MAIFGHSTTGAEVVEHFKDRVKGKIIFITGPGIGAETALSLAAGSPAYNLLAGRWLSKIQTVIDCISAAYPDVKIINARANDTSDNGVSVVSTDALGLGPEKKPFALKTLCSIGYAFTSPPLRLAIRKHARLKQECSRLSLLLMWSCDGRP